MRSVFQSRLAMGRSLAALGLKSIEINCTLIHLRTTPDHIDRSALVGRNRRKRKGFEVFPFDEELHGIVGLKVEIATIILERAARDEVEHRVIVGVGVFHLQRIMPDQDFRMDRKLILSVKGMQLFPQTYEFCDLRRRQGRRYI